MYVVIDTLVVVGLLFIVFNGSVWLGYTLLQFVRERPQVEWGATDIQIRISYWGEGLDEIQKTLNSLPEGFTDIHVITPEKYADEIDENSVTATVHIVPEEFNCNARPGEGRVYEWAQRNIEVDTEYVGYLSAGQELVEFDGLPDVDFVELPGKPIQPEGGSRLVYLSNLLMRNGTVEAYGYSMSEPPMFIDTDAIFIRSEVEQEITWNRPAINISSAFAWLASDVGYTYKYCSVGFTQSECEKELSEVIEKKRHAYSGRVHDSIAYLSLPKWIFNSFRSTSWAVGTFTIPLILVGLFFSPVAQTLATVAALLIVAQSVAGWSVVNETPFELVQLLIYLPIVTIVDGIGYIYGMWNPVDEYKISETGADIDAYEMSDGN